VPDEAGLRRRLVACGMELLEEATPEQLTLRAVARRAGVSHGAPRRHYPTWASLLSAIAAQGFEDLREQLMPALTAPARRPLERLRAAAQAYAAFAAERPGLFAVMFRHDLLHHPGSDLRATSLPVLQDIVALVELAQREQGWRAEEPSLGLASALWSSIHGQTLLSLWGALPVATGEPDPSPVLTTILDVFLERP